MRKSIGLLMSLVGIVAVLLGYFWYDTRAQLQHIIKTIKPFAEVRYSYIYASPFGSAGIMGLEILPYGIDDRFVFDKVGLQGNNFFSLLTINRVLGKGQLPKSLHIFLKDVQVPIDSPLLQDGFGISGSQPPFEFTLCGDVVSFGPAEFQALGYDDLHLDLSLAYNINELKPSMEMTATFNPQAMLAITAKAQLTLPQAVLSLTDLVTLSPRLIELTVTLNDLSLVERLNRFCAKKEAISVSDYIDEQVQYLEHLFQIQGTLFSADLATLYREFMTQGGEIRITASPQQTLPLEKLTNQSFKDTLNRLNLAITVNDLPTLSLEFQQANAFSYSKKELTSDTIRFGEQQNNTSAYLSITHEELASYRGSMVIIQTANGRQHKGQLATIDHNTVKLAQHMRGGSVVFTINIHDIEKIRLAP